MLSATQFEKLTRLGTEMDGRRVLIASETGSRAYYTIQLPRCDGDAVALIPSGNGTPAESTVRRDSYGYDHGGPLYRAAVEAAKELASALGF